MPIMSQKTIKYTYRPEELTKLIASDLNVPVEAVRVDYNLRDSSDDRFGGSPNYGVSDISVTVDMQKVEQLQAQHLEVQRPHRTSR